MGRYSLDPATDPARPDGRLLRLRAVAACVMLLSPVWWSPAIAEEDVYAQSRARMVGVIEEHARLSGRVLDSDALDPRVMEMMGAVPRHAFIPMSHAFFPMEWMPSKVLAAVAYADRPVPIGFGQTMSQPFIVALMTDLLAPEPEHVVLEVGTGSGYQAAVLSHLVQRVCTIEIVPKLGTAAAVALDRLGYGNVEARIGDGYYGWEDCGPFDGIVVTAAAGHIPPPLVHQLKPGGRMVIPVGGPFVTQQLVLVEKHADGSITTRQLLPVRFVPLVREAP